MTPERPRAVRLLIVLLGFQAFSAIIPGLMLVIAPDGSLLHMPTTNLRAGSPFDDFLLPGLILLLLLGVFPLVVLLALRRPRPWAWYGSFTIGCALVIFEIVEYTMIGFSWLQILYGGVGLLIAIVTMLPSVRRYGGAPV